MHEDTLENNNKRFDWTLWRKIFVYAKPYRLSIAAVILCMVILALINSTLPALSKYAIDNFAMTRNTDGLIWFMLLVLAIALTRGVSVFSMIVVSGKVNTRVSYDIRKEAFDHIQTLSFSYFDRKAVGWLISRLTSDASTLGRTLSWGVVDLVWGGAMMLFMSGIMLYLNVKLALVVLAVVPILAFVTFKFQFLILKRFRNVRKINSEITGAFNEGITGAKTTKTLVREQANLDEFRSLTGSMYAASTGAAHYSAVYFPMILFVGAVGTVGVLWVGGNGIIAGDITYGTLVAFAAYAVSFFYPLEELARRLPELQNAQAVAERIFSLIETEAEIKDSAEVLAKYGSGSDRKSKLPLFAGNVHFKDVSFYYKKDETVLEHFNLDVKAGETVALVGETGSGKSTIVNLICRFYEPTAGVICVDGVDYTQLPLKWLQQHLGIIQQTPHLFSGSIADNIRYGKLDAGMDDIIRVAKLVKADEFIQKFDDGYDFDVGENGSKLSTGQKQLLALARVMLADPGLLVLDEATSSIDTETEKIIQDAIDKVTENRTSFIIAHRLSTIRSADRILLIDNGRILEQGTHNELIRKKGHYYDLYSSQFVTEKEHEIMG
jgi:ATP-binding cassette subfamily B protein